VREPEFPLIAIVVTRPEDMYEYAAREGIRIGPGVLGYYSSVSNRVILYDQDRGRRQTKRGLSENEATIIHEATHQTAFNTGIHDRRSLAPRWVCEGLGTLFEAPGVWDSRQYPHQSDRVNRGRLENFQRIAGTLNGRRLGAFIASDQLYVQSPGAAYALGWALTFYLIETQPRKYGQYLARTASLPPFEEYSPAQRTADFTSVFGRDLNLLSAQMVRYLADLK
jgi:hypothetical protein